MRSLRTALAAIGAGAAAFAASASTLRADDLTLFTWSGTVDREAIIVMRGSFLETRGDGFETFRSPQFRVNEALPRVSGSISIARADGRGDIEVIEQPSLFNGYTARVRVRDRQRGADRYRLVVTWEGARGYDRRDRRDDDWRNDDDWRRDRRGGGRDERNDTFGGRRDAGALRFRAGVDAVVEVRIRGRRVDYVTRSGQEVENVRFDVRGAGLPTYAVPLDIRRLAGRGNVYISQYPREWNNWTAVVRIDDSRGGPDAYEFDLRW